jgi:hypothetical protein
MYAYWKICSLVGKIWKWERQTARNVGGKETEGKDKWKMESKG